MSGVYKHSFTLRHHWWLDSGLAGLFYIADDVLKQDSQYSSIKIDVDVCELSFSASTQKELQDFLNTCYEKLADKYWNISTAKQKESKDLVIYYSTEDKLDLIPRRKPTPIPSLFTKGSSFRAEAERYSALEPNLQKRIDEFLKEHHKKLWGNKGLLLYEPPVCHPQITLFPEKGRKSVCCICGQEKVCSDVTQTSFLLFASKSATLSFNSEGKRPDKICWECEFLSKFAVESAHYKTSGDNLYILQLSTSNTKKMIDSHKLLGSQSAVRELEPENFMSNIGTQKSSDRLLFFAHLPYELLWAFFHDTYILLRNETQMRSLPAVSFDPFCCIKLFIENPLQIVLMMISSKGQTFILRELIKYTETAYIFRLLQFLYEAFPEPTFLYRVFHDMYVPGEGTAFDTNNYIWRNRILQRVLQKEPILQEIERMVFHKSLKQTYPYLGNLLEFTKHYQLIIQEGCGMTKEQVEVAVKLGQQIVISAHSAKDGSANSFDRVKGDLFALRKARNVRNFLEQLNRIQFRYNIIVSKQILGGILEDSAVPFEDFKSYCLLAALNTYNNFKRPPSVKPQEN